MTWATWLLGVGGPLVARVLTYLGITALTLVGVDTTVSALISQAQSSWGAMPSGVLSLATLAGVPEALGMMFGAFNARLTLWMAVESTRWITAKG